MKFSLGSIVVPITIAQSLCLGIGLATADPVVIDQRTLISATPSGRPGNAWSTNPAWAPDGTRLAFLSWATNLTGNRSSKPKTRVVRLMVRDLGSGTTRVLRKIVGPNDFSDSGPVWSPDSSKIALIFREASRVHYLWIFDASRGGSTKIAPISRDRKDEKFGSPNSIPAWSPDGTKIAFDANYSGAAEGSVLVSPVPKTGQFSLVSTTNNRTPLYGANSPAWLDSSHVAFMGRTSISSDQWIYSSGLSDNEVAKPIVRVGLVGANRLATSPSGIELLYNNAYSHAYLFNLVTNQRVRLPALDEAENATWSPDGQYIAFNRFKRAGKKGGRYQSRVYSTSSGTARTWTKGNFDSSILAWSHDSRAIAWNSSHLNTIPQIYAQRIR